MSKKLDCPNCNSPAIGYWKKQFLGPARTIGCDHCGARVSVSAKHFLPILILVIGAFPVFGMLGLMKHGLTSTASLFVLVLLITGVYQHFFVPLVVRSRRPH